MSNQEPYYVIVGLGFSAILNHRLLRHRGCRRIGDLRILHIGLSDPWANYDLRKMGQWPSLLALPGYKKQHDGDPPKDFLSSHSFAEANGHERDRINEKHPFDVEYGSVHDVDRMPNGPEGRTFRVSFKTVKGEEKNVVAKKIDFCTGRGPEIELGDKQVKCEDLAKEYFGRTLRSRPRRLMGASVFLSETLHISSGGTICVVGGGGTGAWCVEKALESSEVGRVVWVSGEPFSTKAFPHSGRNDHLASEIRRDSCGLWERGLLPGNKRLELAHGYKIGEVKSSEGRVAITFVNDGQSHVDYEGRQLPDFASRQVEPFLCDQLVVAIGQKTAYIEELISNVMPKRKPIYRFVEFVEAHSEGVLVGVKDEFDQVRVLGPAFEIIKAQQPFGGGNQETKDYFRTLPRQTEGAPIITGALSIALCNDYFGAGNPNKNINTAHAADLSELDVSDALLKERGLRIDPFIAIPDAYADKDLLTQYASCVL
jgi:hypothetical protein